MKTTLDEINVSSFKIDEHIGKKQVRNGTVEEIEFSNYHYKGASGKPYIRIVLHWHMILSTSDLTKIIIGMEAEQVLVCLPDNEGSPRETIRRDIETSYAQLQQAFTLRVKKTALSGYRFQSFDFERASFKVFDLLLNR